MDEKSGMFTPEIVNQLILLASHNLNDEYPFVCNNAAWMLGELVMRLGDPKLLSPYIATILERLVFALHSHEIQDNLKINLAVAIGRLGSICTIEVASMAEDFFCDWCSVLAFPCPAVEKRQAFTGLLDVLRASPDLLIDNKATTYSLLVACVSWSELEPGDLPAHLAKGFGQIFAELQARPTSHWTKVINTFRNNGHSVQTLISLFA